MNVLVIPTGGFQDTLLDVDFLPRPGDTVNLGEWEATVKQVVHIPTRYREGQKAGREHGTEIVLNASRKRT